MGMDNLATTISASRAKRQESEFHGSVLIRFIRPLNVAEPRKLPFYSGLCGLCLVPIHLGTATMEAQT
jgi:hypothetical protein